MSKGDSHLFTGTSGEGRALIDEVMVKLRHQRSYPFDTQKRAVVSSSFGNVYYNTDTSSGKKVQSIKYFFIVQNLFL
ncbi:MAG: hypothetical protein IJU96_02330 [Clostridia bacterium]|nr:hypothetical protein [Clostridia bacterium]